MVSRMRIAATALVLALLATLPAFAAPKVVGVGAIGMTVADMEKSVAFYTETLGFRKLSDTEFHDPRFDRLTGVFGARVRVVRLALGTEAVELTEYLTPACRPIPPDSRSNDGWFQHIAIVVRDMDAAWERLRKHRARPISVAPQRIPDWNRTAAGIRAFYFRDPDGHPLELIWFPAGKGNPLWQEKTEALFLGIDHTAIAVDDTDRSLAFYRDTLGLTVAGESLNHGIEQEYLNHVFGSRVRITGLKAPEGPGIEFLEYLVPRDGRPYPDDAKPCDLFHWQVTLRVEEAEGFLSRLAEKRTRFVSPEAVDVTNLGLEGTKALMVRDPDRHALRLVER
ncbi:VOC family protein [Geobacter sp.]|uniref:VOC family protein n=1 Tax=Geobacter sp. TaxID=46610 RepID=UPI0027B90FDE|nr:VOC family protein [Geobacter sp.]